MRVELTVSGFADLTATATYGTYIAAETGIEPISSESESDVIPLHYSAIADANGFEPLLIVLETIVLPVTPSIYSGCGEIRTHDLRFKRPLLCLLSYTSLQGRRDLNPYYGSQSPVY